MTNAYGFSLGVLASCEGIRFLVFGGGEVTFCLVVMVLGFLLDYVAFLFKETVL